MVWRFSAYKLFLLHVCVAYMVGPFIQRIPSTLNLQLSANSHARALFYTLCAYLHLFWYLIEFFRCRRRMTRNYWEILLYFSRHHSYILWYISIYFDTTYIVEILITQLKCSSFQNCQPSTVHGKNYSHWTIQVQNLCTIVKSYEIWNRMSARKCWRMVMYLPTLFYAQKQLCCSININMLKYFLFVWKHVVFKNR